MIFNQSARVPLLGLFSSNQMIVLVQFGINKGLIKKYKGGGGGGAWSWAGALRNVVVRKQMTDPFQ